MNDTSFSQYAPCEQQLRAALHFLLTVHPELLSEQELSGSFLASCAAFSRPYTARQLPVLYNALAQRRAKLAQYGIVLPERAEVQTLIDHAKAHETHTGTARAVAHTARCFVDIRETDRDNIWIFLRLGGGTRFSTYKARFDAFRREIETKNIGRATFAHDEWRITLNDTVFRLLLSNTYFSTTFTELSSAAATYKKRLDTQDLQAQLEREQQDDAQEREIAMLTQLMGGLDGEFLPGYRLFPHQKEDVLFALHKRRCIIADEPGLGKTFASLWPAVALQRAYGYHIVIVATKSALSMWCEAVQQFQAQATVLGWAELLRTDHGAITAQKYTLVVDEAHNAAYLKSQRTQQYLALAWHPHCQALFNLTGTPVPNGRPINAYPLLLAVQHPLVYGENKAQIALKKQRYEQEFCGKQRKKIGKSSYVMDVNGATNRLKWNRLCVYIPQSDDNHRHACIIRHLKAECRQLPPKLRVMHEVELSPTALKVYQQQVIDLWERFEQGCATKIAAYQATLHQQGKSDAECRSLCSAKEQSIRQAEALVKYEVFRQAGAWAKVESTIEELKQVLDSEDQYGERTAKAVVFTSFPSVAQAIGERIAAECHVEVGYILGETKEEERTRIQHDFQSNAGHIRVVLCTKAGGESINLNGTPRKPCQYLFIVDRPWTPGLVQQWEDRIYRINNTGSVTVFWMRLPSSVSNADIHNDAIIQRKAVSIDALVSGKDTQGLEFLTDRELEEAAEHLMYSTYLRAKKRKG